MANMIPISTVVVGSGGTTSIEFNNISQGYTDLILKLSSRTSRAVVGDGMILSINGSTASIVTTRTLQGNGAAASSFTSPSGSDVYIGDTDGANATASTFGNTEVYIPNYSSSNNKTFSTDHVSENNSTTAYAQITAGIWASTATITSIAVKTLNSSTFIQYSTATLYGIRKY